MLFKLCQIINKNINRSQSPDPFEPVPIFPAIFFQKIFKIMIYYHKRFQPDWTKNGHGLLPKKHMPIYGMIDILRGILAYDLAKYQFSLMRPD